MSPIILVGGGILLLGLGLGLGYWLANSKRNREVAKAVDIQNELDDYRRKVNEHFGETAQQFQSLGQQYQSLYRHMAEGADALCDSTQSAALLGFATASAPAIAENAASTTEESEESPEVIKDYAAAEEIEPPQPEPIVEAAIEVADTSEPLESSPVPDDAAVEPPAEDVEDVIADQVATPAPTETERMVH